MFPASYFAPRYFTLGYFPHVGRTPVLYDVLRIGAAHAGTAGAVARVGVATSLAGAGAVAVAAHAGAASLTAGAGAAVVEARTHLTEAGP